jgi:hypothetical protein
MCPFCFTTMAAIVIGLSSIGGVSAAAVLKRQPVPASEKTGNDPIGRKTGGSRSHAQSN